ncbi:MAG: DMT family transporter [Pseudomonadota bacterium]
MTNAARAYSRAVWSGLSPTAQGVALAAGVAVMFACMDACARAIGQRYDPLLGVWWRYASQGLGVAIVFAPRLRTVVRTRRLGMQIFRSSLLFTATCLFFSGFALLPLATVTAIALLGPLLIVALAALLLGERVGPWRWLGVAAGLCGALVIVRPWASDAGGSVFEWAALFPIGGAFAYAAFNIATRSLGRDEDVWTTFFYTAVVGAVGASLFLPFVWETPRLVDLPLLLAVGGFGAIGQLALIMALKRAPASVVAPLHYTQLIWSAMLGWLLFAEIPGVWVWTGAALIVAAGLFVQWRERRAAARR